MVCSGDEMYRFLMKVSYKALIFFESFMGTKALVFSGY